MTAKRTFGISEVRFKLHSLVRFLLYFLTILGIAEYYATLLPHRFRLVPPSYVTARVNGNLLEYYTNLEINMTMRDVLKYVFTSWHAEWIPYNRGFAYFLLVDGQLRRLPGHPDSYSVGLMDQIIIDLSLRHRWGQVIQRKDWLAGVGYFLQGRVDYVQQLQDMLDGKSINLASRRIGSTRNTLRETTQNVMHLGFSKLSTYRKIVEGLVPGSRAEQAGLRNGDKIVDIRPTSDVAKDPFTKCHIVVDRNWKNVRIEYLPREDREVFCWQLESFKEDVIPSSFISGP